MRLLPPRRFLACSSAPSLMWARGNVAPRQPAAVHGSRRDDSPLPPTGTLHIGDRTTPNRAHSCLHRGNGSGGWAQRRNSTRSSEQDESSEVTGAPVSVATLHPTDLSTVRFETLWDDGQYVLSRAVAAPSTTALL